MSDGNEDTETGVLVFSGQHHLRSYQEAERKHWYGMDGMDGRPVIVY